MSSRRYEYLLQGNTGFNSTFNSNTIGSLITTGGNIGIGTSSPGEKLDIRGNLRVGNNTQANYISFFGVSGDGPSEWNHSYIGERIYDGNDLSELLLFKGNDPNGPDRIRLLAPEIKFDTYTGYVSGTFEGVATHGTNRMTITTAGNVGIGTTAPAYILDVNGTIDAVAYTGGNISISGGITSSSLLATSSLVRNSGAEFEILNTNYVTGGTSGIKFSQTGNAGNNAYIRSFLPGANVSDLHFIGYNGTNNITSMAIKGDGNIGIGTTSPNEKLEVRGNLRVGNNTQANYISFFGVNGDGPSEWNHSYIGERIYNGNDLSELLLFKGNDPSGASGPDRIRFLAPEIKFDTYTGNVSGTFEGVATQGTNRMTITTAGNMTINTTRTSGRVNLGGGIDMDGGNCYISGYGTGPLTIDPNFTSNNYVQIFDELRVDSGIILKGSGITTSSIVATTYTGGNMQLSGTITCGNFRSRSDVLAEGNIYASGFVTAGSVNASNDISAKGTVYNGGFDFILGNANQVDRGNSGLSRALVKYNDNKLVLNFNNDFSGGVEVQSSLYVPIGITCGNINISNDNISILRFERTGTGRFDYEMGLDGGGDLIFRGGSNAVGSGLIENMRLKSNGLLGIGRDPTYTLDVNGTCRINTTRGVLIGSSTDIDGTRLISALDSGMANNTARYLTFGKTNSDYNQAELLFYHVSNSSTNNYVGLSLYGLAPPLIVKGNGRVGINTTNPAHALDVNGTIDASTYTGGSMSLAGNISSPSGFGRYDGSSFWSGFGGYHAGYISSTNGDGSINTYNGSQNSLTRDGLYIRGGRIGIGTGSPDYPLHVSGSVNVTYDPNFFINGPGVVDPGNQNGNFSAYFSNAIRASEIWGNSDARIKTNIKDINDPDSLYIIRQLQPKTFSFLNDWKSDSELRVNYGFIAQEVETVLPDAVTHSTEIIPNIMETCEVKILKDENDVSIGSRIDLVVKSIPESWKSGRKIQIINKNGEKSFVTIKSIDTSKSFTVEETLKEPKYFVYGEEIYDFRSVHRDVIYAVTTAAVQELDKQLQIANEKINNYENKLTELENKLNELLNKS